LTKAAREKPTGETNVRPIRGRCANCGGYFKVMARLDIHRILPDPKLDALTAEKVFGWQNVHKHHGALVGKKRIRPAIGDGLRCQTIQLIRFTRIRSENRMKQLGRSDRYQNELSKKERKATA
jgi:hypothetical protein